MAAVKPSGPATNIATRVLRSVPFNSGRMPYRGLANRGVQTVSVKKSRIGTLLKKASDSWTRTPTIARVMNTDEAAHRKRMLSITRSRARNLRRRCAFSRVAIAVSGHDAGEHRFPRESFG
jgi:hypothetical protein